MLKEKLNKLVKIAEDKKAEHICAYEVAGNNCLTDYMVIMQANNSIHINSIIEDYNKELAKIVADDLDNFYDRPKVSGSAESSWIILDLNSIIIHIMTEEKREFYKLDSIFSEQGPVFHY